MATARKRVLKPKQQARTDNPEFISDRGREFFAKKSFRNFWEIKSPENGNIPRELTGTYSRKRVAEDAIRAYLMGTNRTGKAVIKNG